MGLLKKIKELTSNKRAVIALTILLVIVLIALIAVVATNAKKSDSDDNSDDDKSVEGGPWENPRYGYKTRTNFHL